MPPRDYMEMNMPIVADYVGNILQATGSVRKAHDMKVWLEKLLAVKGDCIQASIYCTNRCPMYDICAGKVGQSLRAKTDEWEEILCQRIVETESVK